jgi:hypothetical protein
MSYIGESLGWPGHAVAFFPYKIPRTFPISGANKGGPQLKRPMNHPFAVRPLTDAH